MEYKKSLYDRWLRKEGLVTSKEKKNYLHWWIIHISLGTCFREITGVSFDVTLNVELKLRGFGEKLKRKVISDTEQVIILFWWNITQTNQ